MKPRCLKMPAADHRPERLQIKLQTCWAVEVIQCTDMQIFAGEGRNKRAAEHAAASKALAFIDSLGMLAPPRPQMLPQPSLAMEAPVTAEEVRR